MEEERNQQGLNGAAAEIYELPGEPAIVINGVPDIVPGVSIVPFNNGSNNVETQRHHRGLGEWFEGREVRKWFMGRYYSGTVTGFEKETGWYRVHYEDGDSEDLDWHELEEVLLPLDVTVPLKTLTQKIIRRTKKSVQKNGKGVVRTQNPQSKRRTT